MDSKVLILSSKVSLNTTIPKDKLSEYNNDYFVIEEDSVQIPCSDWFNKNLFEESMISLQKYIHDNKNKIKGMILVFVKENDEIHHGVYVINSKKILFEPCEFNITIKKRHQQTQKQFTDDEKLNLFREYWHTKHDVPGKTEVYKGFKIGQYYTSMMKNMNTIEIMNQIMEQPIE